uniref:Uncharacterized protein n=1 Tax=Triticum urartu TaxID=4572 RepID=A0A8R7Q900_TRIUA
MVHAPVHASLLLVGWTLYATTTCGKVISAHSKCQRTMIE